MPQLFSPPTTYESTKIEKLGQRGNQQRFLHFNSITRRAASRNARKIFPLNLSMWAESKSCQVSSYWRSLIHSILLANKLEQNFINLLRIVHRTNNWAAGGTRGGAVDWGESIPDCVIGIFHWHNPSCHTKAFGLTKMSTRNISFGGVGWLKRPVRRADNLTTFICRLSWNLGASTSWNSQGLSKPVMGLLYFYK
jgi:hypothetical protein